MGIDVYIVNHKSKSLFGMGKCVEFCREGLPEWKTDPLILLERLCRTWAFNKEFSAGYVLLVRDRIWRFIQGAAPDEIEVIADTDERFFDLNYKYASDRYSDEKQTQEYCSQITSEAFPVAKEVSRVVEALDKIHHLVYAHDSEGHQACQMCKVLRITSPLLGYECSPERPEVAG